MKAIQYFTKEDCSWNVEEFKKDMKKAGYNNFSDEGYLCILEHIMSVFADEEELDFKSLNSVYEEYETLDELLKKYPSVEKNEDYIIMSNEKVFTINY